jgi:hypothetical protein
MRDTIRLAYANILQLRAAVASNHMIVSEDQQLIFPMLAHNDTAATESRILFVMTFSFGFFDINRFSLFRMKRAGMSELAKVL